MTDAQITCTHHRNKTNTKGDWLPDLIVKYNSLLLLHASMETCHFDHPLHHHQINICISSNC